MRGIENQEYSKDENNKGALRIAFDRCLKLESHGSKLTSDAGLLACRELDQAQERTQMAGGVMQAQLTCRYELFASTSHNYLK